MSGNQKKNYNMPVIVLCIILLILVIGLGGITMCLLIQSRHTQGVKRGMQETESELFETEVSIEDGELYYEGVDEKHVLFDEETGLQYADNQLLITVTSGVSKADVEKLISPYQAEIIGMIEVMNIYQIRFSESYTKEELDEIGKELCENDEIESYKANAVIDIDISAFYPNDEKWESEWGDKTPYGINWGMEAIHAPETWEYYDEMQDVNIGVYDNMFYDHEDIEFNEIFLNMQGKKLNHSHGTHVSGTIGATFNNKKGVCGVFPKAILNGTSFQSMEGMLGNEMGTKAAFTYLIWVKKCKVINLSIGTNLLTFAASRGNEAALNAIENSAKEIGEYLHALLLLQNDFVICKAAGNGNSTEAYIQADPGDADACYGYIPYNDDNREFYEKYENEEGFNDRIVYADKVGYVEANDWITSISNEDVKKRILVVGSAKNLGNGKYEISDFSNCGKRVDVVAPGEDIYSTTKTNEYEGGWNGTSMATPHVTGVAALCFSVNENLDGAQVADIVRSTAEGNIQYSDSNTNGSRQFSYPMVNAEKAVKKALKMKTEKVDEKETTKQRDNVSRDVVLVLDRSGSMYGNPMEQTKEAATKFVETVFEQDSRVAVVSYESYAAVECGLTDNQQELASSIENLYTDGCTNMYGGLEQADNILASSQADRKIIVLMSDGLPNEGIQDNGDYSAALLRYAEEMKNKGYYIYTLGFFTDVSGGELYSAQQLMEGIASPGLHYEVNSADDLVFFFGDIADQISGTRYVYIRIACPVDVTVTSNGEILSSKADVENTRTSFGALTYETIQEESENEDEIDYSSIYDSYYNDTGNSIQDRVKVLRLNMDEDYDVEIEGYDRGIMDYSVSFPNEKGEYDDVRKFPNIAVTSSMKATSNTSESDATYLEVDEDGDGKVDTTYKTKANGKMEEVEENNLLFILLIAGIVVAVLVLILIIVLLCVSGKKKKHAQRGNQGSRRAVGNIYGAFGLFGGQSYPMCLGQQCVVGRKSSCDIQLVHGQVSRVHCVIEMLPDGVYQVTDYSSNGTFYNNQRLKSREPYRLPKGALLAIGDADNVLELK